METHGIVEIDEYGTWYLPTELDEQDTQDLLDAWKLTWRPGPWVGSHQRAMRNIREALECELQDRDVDAREHWLAKDAEEAA